MLPAFKPALVTGSALLATLGAISCGGGGDGGSGPVEPPAVVAAAVSVTPMSVSVLVGATTPLTAIARNAAGSPIARAIVWSTGNSSVASVAVNGVVTGIAAGTTTIRATADGVFGEATITVTPVPVAAVAILPVSPLVPGETITAQATVRDASNAVLANRAVTWSSGAESVATITTAGVITAVKMGSVMITATSEGISGQITLQVDDGGFVTPPGNTITAVAGRVVMAFPAQTVTQGTAFRIHAAANPPTHPKLIAGTVFTVGPTDTPFAKPVSMSIRFETLATGVIAEQLRLHKWNGTAWTPVNGTVNTTTRMVTGTVNSTGMYGLIEIPVPVTTVTVTPPASTLNINTTVQLTATVRGPAGQVLSDRQVTWSTSNDASASVSVTGVVTAVASGDPVTISATSEGIVGTAIITVRAPITFTSIATGYLHTCALTPEGAAWCWGQNASCELGTGTCTAPITSPVSIHPTLRFRQIAPGDHFTCGILLSGATQCWGNNSFGTLGNGTFLSSAVPVTPVGGHTFVSISTGANHVCGLTAGGSAYCWGDNDDGAIGDSTGLRRNAPSKVSGGYSFLTIVTGREHTCGLTEAHTAYCWGENIDGELGDGTFQDRHSPTLVGGGRLFTKLAAGEWHNCGISAALETWCWGWNEQGQVGDGSKVNRGQPTRVTGGDVFTSIFPSGWSTCGLLASGEAKCWGDGGDAQIGDGANVDRLLPTAVSGGHQFITLTRGLAYHYCGRRIDGVVLCWGMNDTGQLGIGTTVNALTPTVLPFPAPSGSSTAASAHRRE